MGEGHHLYKINGKYVDVSAIPGGPVDQMVAVADSIDGPWKVTRMVEGESLGVTSAAPARASAGDRGLWIHQGGIVDTPSGQWWSIIMSDHGSAGRMVNLVPITWDDGFPLIGLPGNLRKAPNTWIKPDTGHVQAPKPAFIHDDDFDSGELISRLAVEPRARRQQVVPHGEAGRASPPLAACGRFLFGPQQPLSAAAGP